MNNDIKKIALAIVQDDEGDVLIVKRKKPEKSSKNEEVLLKWAFPGGVIEDSEEPQETAVQEVLEETGHYVKANGLINKRVHPEFSVDISYFECELTTNATTQLIDDHEIEQIAWVSPSRLRKEFFETDLDDKVAKHLGI